MTARIHPWAAFAVPLALFLVTLEPGVYFVDSGSHLTAATVLGVTNPPGFPSYIAVAHLFSKLPVGGPAERIHLLSALSAALTCLLVYRLVVRLLAVPPGPHETVAPPPAAPPQERPAPSLARRGKAAGADGPARPPRERVRVPAVRRAVAATIGWTLSGRDRGVGAEPARARTAALAAALALAFTYNFWSQALNSESFAWTNLWAVAALLLLLRVGGGFERAERNGIAQPPRGWLLPAAAAAAAYGMAAGGHPGIVCVAPAFLVFVLRWRGQAARQPGEALFCLLSFLAVAGGWYLYLPLRASGHPPLNWGDPDTFERFVGHLYGQGLNVSDPNLGLHSGFTLLAAVKAMDGGEVARSAGTMAGDLLRTLGLALWQFSPLLVPVWVAGAARLARERAAFAPAILAVVAAEVALSATYHGANNENWHITSYIVLAVCAGYALGRLPDGSATGAGARIVSTLAGVAARRPAAVLLFPAVVLAWTAAWHASALMRRGHVWAEELCANLYGRLPRNAVLLDRGDLLNSLNSYQRFVVKLRPDVVGVVDNMLHAVDWYRDNLRRWSDVDLSLRLENEIRFRDVNEYHRMMNLFVADNLRKRPVFAMPAVMAGLKLSSAYKAVPAGLAYRIVPAGETARPSEDDLAFSFRDPHWYERRPFFLERSYRSAYREIVSAYAQAHIIRGDFDLSAGRAEGAVPYYRAAIAIAPWSAEAVARMGLYLGQSGRHEDAIVHFERAVKLDREAPNHRINLGTAYRQLGRLMEAQEQYLAAARLDRDPSKPTAGIAQRLLEEMRTPPAPPGGPGRTPAPAARH